MDAKAVGKGIREQRTKAGYTQEQFAEMCALSPFYISQMERGIKTPSLESLVHIANALHTSADAILYQVLDHTLNIKATILSDRLAALPLPTQRQILEILDALLRKG